MFITSILNKIASGSLILTISAQAASSIPIAAAAYITQVSFASSAVAALPTKRNAQGLLLDLRVSFGMIAGSYKETFGIRHRSATNVLEGVTRAARANQRLEDALATHSSKAIADATGSLSRAIGELQTLYALTPAQNRQAAQGMRYLNAAWKTYSSRYVLSTSGNQTKTVSRAEVRALREKVTALQKRVSSLEGQVSANATLQRQMARLRQDLAYYDSRPDDDRTYQHMLFTLTMVAGSFDALAYTTRVYYPTYYVYLEPVSPEFYIWRSYWDGFYDGYYEGRSSVWYDEPVVVEGPLVQINQIEVNQEITYQTIYNMADEIRVEYESLPQENLTEIDIPATPEDTIFIPRTLARTTDDDVISKVDETTPVAAEPNGISSQPDEEYGLSNDKGPDMTAPRGSEDHFGSVQRRDMGIVEEINHDNNQDDSLDDPGDLPQKNNILPAESEGTSHKVPPAKLIPQQQMEPQEEGSDSIKCQEDNSSC